MLNYNHCYHGTSVPSYHKIKNSSEFIHKERKNHWLGQGVYFFIEDKEKAIWFVKVSHSPEIQNASKCVIDVPIQIDEESFLNLDTEDGRKKLSDFRSELEKNKIKLEKNKRKVDEEANAKLRCLLIDLYAKYYEIKAVKYTFTDDKLEYRKLNINSNETDKIENTGIQLNVIDQSVINFDELSVEYI